MSNLETPTNLLSLADQYLVTRQLSIEIASPLSNEDMQLQSMPDASPIKWHLAHTTWAFETFILTSLLPDYAQFDKHFEYLFNSYYNAIGKQFSRAKRGLLSRPDIDEVIKYRQHVDNAILKWLAETENTPLSKNKYKEAYDLLLLLINHEQQHQELMLTDIQHALSVNPCNPVYRITKKIEHQSSPLNWVDFDGGLTQIGHQNEHFYFDNEGPRHQYFIDPFKFASRLVSCGEYLDFIENGGYQESSFWLSEAWGKINEENLKAPLYWQKQAGKWFQFTLSGLQPLDLNAPLSCINYFEANAYANSINKRLPTEQEWEVAARSMELVGSFYHPDKLTPTCTRNSDSQSDTSSPQLEQMFGELWQWTSSSYNAYPGFRPSTGAIGEYNGKFMVNQYVLRGGSFATQLGHIRASYRNFFYPNASWQYSGIRLAESLL